MPRRATSTSYGGKAGNSPNKTVPGTGAPPKTFIDRMRLLASRAETVARLEKALTSKDDAVFLKAFSDVANRGYGRAPESLEVSGKGGGPLEVRVRIVDEGRRVTSS